MRIAKRIATFVVFTILATPLFAAEDDAKAFGQFQEYMAAIDQRSFSMVEKMFDQTDLMNRVFGHRTLDADLRDYLRTNFSQIIESSFMQSIPPAGSRVKVALVEFSFTDGRGRAAIRYKGPQHTYTIIVFELRHDKRGRLKLVDWFDSRHGSMLTAQINDGLLAVKPSKQATRNLLSVRNPTDQQLFQVTEILKAARDRQPQRFFEIYDGLDEPLKKESLLVRRAVEMAVKVKDFDRIMGTLDIFVEVSAEDPNLALMISDLRILLGDYEDAYRTLSRFHDNFAVQEGAIPAKLSALALATGKLEEAEKYAVEATLDEPGLELGWWSLLRARTAGKDYQGALEALTQLEDNFGQRLDAAKLRRDKYRAFTRLASSQEFKDWRAGRN